MNELEKYVDMLERRIDSLKEDNEELRTQNEKLRAKTNGVTVDKPTNIKKPRATTSTEAGDTMTL